MVGPTSLRRRLAARIDALLLALWVAVIASVAVVVHHETEEIFDSSLQETSQRLLSLVMADPHLREGTDVPEIREIAAHDEYLVYQVFGRDGRMLLRSHQAPVEPFAVPLVRGFHRVDGRPMHVETTSDSSLIIAVAEPSTHRGETLRSVLGYLILPLGALLPLAWLAVGWTIRVAQRPIDAFATEIASRGEGNLDPMPTEALPDELRGIGASTNLLLERLALALEAERSFSANCAHELRTPLAAAMAQLKVAEGGIADEASRQRVARAHALLGRLQQTTERLLQLARAESGIGFSVRRIDLRVLVDMVLRDLPTEGRGRVIYDRPEQPVEASGDIDALGIALQNLVTNADRYAPPGTAIAVSLSTDATIVVSNDCEAVPPELLSRLRERFVRGRAGHDGSGLGLCMVDTIARQSGGSLTLESPFRPDGRGFRATLRLRR